ncbi:MAG: ComEA family DNA-binding protein [Xanthomonadaceae bacterium]|nr:ComEA family DNA-binding protein [Xanthomonadaceae bacterium]
MIKHILLAMVLALGISNAVLAQQPVDINTASVEQLAEALNGVGESKARAIVEYRETNGPFTHLDELINVRGIGMVTVDKNRDMIQVESTDSSE